VTIHGFNGASANKLLPLFDGRSLDSMHSSWALCYQRPPSLDEIERIEVVRGSGAAVSGREGRQRRHLTPDPDVSLRPLSLGNNSKEFPRTVPLPNIDHRTFARPRSC
jgi:hypothetical protein